MSRISLILSVLALLVSFSGGAFAAKVALAPRNTVNTQSIMDGSIRLKDLHPTARQGMRGPQGERGQPGAQGPPGNSGLQGVQGPAGIAGGFNPAKVSYVFASNSSVGPSSSGESTALCAGGAIPIAGGGLSSVGKLGTSWAVPGGWKISVYNDTGITITIAAFVVCAAP